MTGRLTLLVGSPRIAPGLFTRTAWQALDAADAVLARDDVGAARRRRVRGGYAGGVTSASSPRLRWPAR